MSRTLKVIVAALIAIVLTAGLLYVKLKKEQEANPANTNIVENPIVSEPVSTPVSEQAVLDALAVPATEQPMIDEQVVLDALAIPAIEQSDQSVIDEQAVLEALSVPAK